MSVTLFGKRVFAGDHVKMRSLGGPYDLILIKRGNLDEEAYVQSEDDVKTHREYHLQTRNAWDHQKLGESREQFLPSRLPEEANPADTLILDFYPSRTVRQYIAIV